MEILKEEQSLEEKVVMLSVLSEFAGLVKEYGVHNVISAMDEGTFWHLYKWFGDNFGLDFKRG